MIMYISVGTPVDSAEGNELQVEVGRTRSALTCVYLPGRRQRSAGHEKHVIMFSRDSHVLKYTLDFAPQGSVARLPTQKLGTATGTGRYENSSTCGERAIRD